MNATMTYAPKVSDSVVAEISTSQKIADIFKVVGLKKSPKTDSTPTYLCELDLTDKTIHAFANEESLVALFDDLDDYGKVRIWDLMKGLNVSYVVDHKGWKFCVVITYNPNSIAFKAKRLWVHRKFLKAQGLMPPLSSGTTPKSPTIRTVLA